MAVTTGMNRAEFSVRSSELIRSRSVGPDSNYVFGNLFGRPHGHPLTYPAVCDLVGRLRRRTGIIFGPRR